MSRMIMLWKMRWRSMMLRSRWSMMMWMMMMLRRMRMRIITRKMKLLMNIWRKGGKDQKASVAGS